MAPPSNTRLNYAGPTKKKAFAHITISAGLLMEIINLLPNNSNQPRRRNAMDSGIKGAAVMVKDANLDTKK